VRKRLAPQLFDVEAPILYAWPFDEGERHAATIARLAERMHTLGLGSDAAFASAEVVTWEQAESKLASHRGRVARPHGPAKDGATCPTADSFDSLMARYRDAEKRFCQEGKTVLYSNIRKPRFRQVAYDSPPVRLLFDLVGDATPWRLDRIVELTERVRDSAAKKLKDALPQGTTPQDKLPREAIKIENAIIGRRDANDADKAARLRITPLPSIGHQHADRTILRILVEIPPNCPLPADDLEWAFSGLDAIVAKPDPETGELRDQVLLTAAADRCMLTHYGIGEMADAQPARVPNLTQPQRGATPARLWRTVTPAALPPTAARRRIDPARMRAEAKGGAERAKEETNAVLAVIQALRHAGVTERPVTVRVQREPFEAKGTRAESFAPGTRFAKERLWHIEVAFTDAVRAPLILGDGRYLGLGLMAPVKHASRSVIALDLPPDARVAIVDRAELLRAVRRALMALARDNKGNVPPLFSGHGLDGAAARSGRHQHVFIGDADLDGDTRVDQLIVAAPWVCDHSVWPRRTEPADFDRVVGMLNLVRAGRLGVIPLSISCADQKLIGPAQVWESHTDYHPCRHAGRGKDPITPLFRDVAAECERRGLPRPDIELLDLLVGPKDSIAARLRLRFAVAVTGPILLGRDSHQGGGFFEAIVR
jgi:CRISPR-associated protein Csb2